MACCRVEWPCGACRERLQEACGSGRRCSTRPPPGKPSTMRWRQDRVPSGAPTAAPWGSRDGLRLGATSRAGRVGGRHERRGRSGASGPGSSGSATRSAGERGVGSAIIGGDVGEGGPLPGGGRARKMIWPYAELSAFELEPIGVFDDFCEALNPLTGAEDPEIKEYLLLSAADDDAGDEDDDALPVVVRNGRPRVEDPGAFPRPPPQAAAASLALSDTVMRSRRPQYPGADAWAKIKR